MNQLLQIDERIMTVLIKSTRDGLAMAGLKPVPTGISKRGTCKRNVSAIIGFAGATSGSLMVNASTECACLMAGKMIGENLETLNSQALDGVCEIANIIAGQVKALLSTTEHKFERISTPSVVVGSNYFISHYRGMTTLSVDFEFAETPIDPSHDYTFSVSICLMKV